MDVSLHRSGLGCFLRVTRGWGIFFRSRYLEFFLQSFRLLGSEGVACSVFKVLVDINLLMIKPFEEASDLLSQVVGVALLLSGLIVLSERSLSMQMMVHLGSPVY